MLVVILPSQEVANGISESQKRKFKLFLFMNRFKKKISSNKSLIESFFSLSILNGLNVVLPLVTIPYILRIVGVANYGVYSYVYVLIQYLLLFNQFGFNYSATKQIAQHRNNMVFINRIYSSVLIFRILLLIAGVIVFIILSPLLLDTKEIRIMFSTKNMK